jgi:DNA-directed RNA polymerase
MTPTQNRIVESIRNRLNSEVSNRDTIRYLKELVIEDYIDIAISTIYLYSRTTKSNPTKKALFSEVICGIGHAIRTRYNMPRKSAVAAKTGAFILYSFEEESILQLSYQRGTNNHGVYVIEILNEDSLSEMWSKLSSAKTEKLPSIEPYSDWTTSRHMTGMRIIKTNNQELLDKVNPEKHPVIFSVLNKKQHVGWRVNEFIFNLYQWALRNKTDAFADIWCMQNPEAKASKLREAKAVGDIASNFIGKTFYHLYYCDFRGRIYPATAYFHEQGSDLAKGLLLRDDSKCIGKSGFEWLCISIANNWAGDSGREDGAKTDKIPLRDRIRWAEDNEEIFLAYADNPKLNQGWMQADKPWQFLAACRELYNFRVWQMNVYDLHKDVIGEYDYESHMEVYIDGSTNGSQHLTALTRDESTAPHVNLTPSQMPGDLYKYVSEKVWEMINQDVNKLQRDLYELGSDVIDELLIIKENISKEPLKSDRRANMVGELHDFKKAHKDILEMTSSCIFWSRITDAKQRRKISKRY